MTHPITAHQIGQKIVEGIKAGLKEGPMRPIYDTTTAAAYLGISPSGIKKAIFRDKTLSEDGRIGRTLYFFRWTLDAYRGQPSSPPAQPVHPLSTEQAADRMGLAVAAFRSRAIQPDGRLANTLYYWPATIDAALASADQPSPDYTMTEAAAYLGLPWSTLKYHIYHEKMLRPDYKRGRYIVFKRKTLDRFRLWYDRTRGVYAAKQNNTHKIGGDEWAEN